MKTSPAPTLRTDRLILAPLVESDLEALHTLLRLEPVRRYLLDGELVDADWVAAVLSDSREDFAKTGLGIWSVREPDDPTLLGMAGYRSFFDPPTEELLYALHPDAWGRGIAREASDAVIDQAFSVAGRDCVRASTDVPNEASLALMKRLGMEEVRRESRPPECKWDQVHCALEREAWVKLRSDSHP